MIQNSKILWLSVASVVIATGLNTAPASAELFKIGAEKLKPIKVPRS